MVRHRLAVLALLILLGPALTQDAREETPAPPAGTWKMMMTRPREATLGAMWLVRFEKKEEGWTGKLVAKAPGALTVTLDKVAVAKGTLRFTIKSDELALPCEFRLGDDPKADKLFGSGTVKKQAIPIELRRTAVASLDEYELSKESLAREPLGFGAVSQALDLVAQAEENEAKPAEVRSWAEKAVRWAELYGPEWQRDVLVRLAGRLGRTKAYEAVALQYARRAERTLEGKEAPAVQKRVLATLATILEKGGKADEAKAVQARVAKLDFRIKPVPFAGRKSKSDRIVLAELFTGSQSDAFAAADLALDAFGKTYKPTEVVALRYHQHVPGPNPLSNADAEARLGFYAGGRRNLAIPMAVLDGKTILQPVGSADDAAEVYEDLVGAIDPLLEKQAGAAIKLKVVRKGDKLTIGAEVSGIAKPGEDVRLRVALIEDGVAYKGASGTGRHSGVVRHMPGGPDGTVLKEKAKKYEFEVDLAKVKKGLAAYLKEFGEKRPFPDKEQPLELKALRVVAFVQDDRTAEVLQAAVADVASEKE